MPVVALQAPPERERQLAARIGGSEGRAAAGVAGLVTKDMVKPGAAVVGAGTSWSGKKLMSDVDDAVAEVAGWITPRIGGVGPMTRAMLLRNAVLAAEKVR